MDKNPNPFQKERRFFGWSILLASFLLILVYFCFYLKSIPDNYGYYLLGSMAFVFMIGSLFLLFRCGEIKRFSALDGILLSSIIIPILLYLFLSWGSYPRIWNILFFGVPACSVQFLFYRIMRPKFIKILPLILSTAFAFWEFFVFKNSFCIEFQLPAFCCIGTYLYLKKGAKHELL